MLHIIRVIHSNGDKTFWGFDVEENYWRALEILQENKVQFNAIRAPVDWILDEIYPDRQVNDAEELRNCLIERGEILQQYTVQRKVPRVEVHLSKVKANSPEEAIELAENWTFDRIIDADGYITYEVLE